MDNATVRDTSNPVTPIDVVGGRRWILRGNFIHDHAKGGGNNVSYAAFLKGNSRDGIMERNLVICELNHTGQVRLGLSLGGGGSGPDKICEDSTCTPEHQNGILRNNIIVNCPLDVGIYLNEAANTKLYHNTLYNTTGIDVRFEASTADVRYNVLDGKIRERNGGTSTETGNLAQVSDADFKAWFTDPAASDFSLVDGAALVDKGSPLAEVTDDFCTNTREDGAPDLGAVEYNGDGDCPTTTPFVPPVSNPDPEPDTDGGSTGADASDGTSGTDASSEILDGSGAESDAGPVEEDMAVETLSKPETSQDTAGEIGSTPDPGKTVPGGDPDSGGCVSATGPHSGAVPCLLVLGLLLLVVRRRSCT
jgi:parallel beta-helix repeat protein